LAGTTEFVGFIENNRSSFQRNQAGVNAEVQRGTEVCTCTLTVQDVAGVCAVQSQIENYRAKAKEFARLTVVAKSLRHSRQYRRLAQMYRALALGEEPDRAQPSKANVKRNTT
jgi:hypothetical protein